MAPENEVKPNLNEEEPLEPDLLLCDPHHHLWDRPTSRYLLDEILADIGKNRVTQTVFVQCRALYRKDGPEELRCVGETESVHAIGEQSLKRENWQTNVAAGIVGYADLTLGAAVTPVLEAHIEASPTRFKGIRHCNAWDAYNDIVVPPNPGKGLLLNPKFREGFACLGKYHLSFDAWMFHPQLKELIDLALAFPDIPIILNHIGGPVRVGPYAAKRAEVARSWKKDMAELATCPNVAVKIGGFGMPLMGFGWHETAQSPGSAELAKAIRPYFQWCIEKFGVDRCMFESNFPVDKISFSYTVMWNAFKLVSLDLTKTERAGLLHDNAVKAYRLPSDRRKQTNSFKK
jgi:L-fuconolactonase